MTPNDDLHCDHTPDWGCPKCDPDNLRPKPGEESVDGPSLYSVLPVANMALYHETTNFVKPILPDWTRWSWASVAERQYWQPLFTQASQDFVYAEKYAVVTGLRDACWQPVAPEDLVGQVQWATRHGLLCVPTHQIRATGAYGSLSEPARPGQPSTFRCLYVRPDFFKRTLGNDDESLGVLLGYPECCRQHFAETWGKGQVDSTWEQYCNTADGIKKQHTLLRWLGIRLVSHMPCSYDCPASSKMADDMLHFGLTQLGPAVKESFLLIKQVLDLPIEWSSKFGIAEIVTPCVKISTRSDWTAEKRSFKKPGTYTKPDATFWTDNGFKDHAAMRENHAIVMNSLIELLPQKARVFDLGCGNGALLRRLTIHRPDIKIGGVDSNAKAIERIPSMTGRFKAGTIQDWAKAHFPEQLAAEAAGLIGLPAYLVDVRLPLFDAVLVNPVRLLEMDPADAAGVLKVLSGVKQVFLYTYDDLQSEDLEALAVKAGFPAPQMLQKTPSVSVGLVLNG